MAKCFVLLLTSLWISDFVLSTDIVSSITIFPNDISESPWKVLDNHSYLKMNITIEQKRAKLFRKTKNVIDELQHLESTSAISYDALKDAITSIIRDSRDEQLFFDLFKNMVKIDEHFKLLHEYSEEGYNADSTTMTDFAKEAVSHGPTSTKMIMDKIHQYISPKIKHLYRGGLLKLLADNMNDTSESSNQLLANNLFDKIARMEIKGYTIAQFSYVILEISGQGHYPQERTLATKNFRKNWKKMIRMSTKLFHHDQKVYKKEYSSIAAFAQNIINSSWITVDHSDIQLNKTIKQKQARTSQKIRNVDKVFWQLEQPISAITYDLIAKVTQSTMKYFRDLYSYMDNIDQNFELLLQYTEDEDSAAILNFANEAISSLPTSTKMIMDKIHQIIIPKFTNESRDGLMKLLADNIEPPDEFIRITGESQNQLLYKLFNRIVLAQMKAYAVVQFSYVILEIYGKRYDLTESKLANKKIRKILKELSQETIRMTAKFSQHYWRVDPEEYRREENYLEITRLLQGYVANEKILNIDRTCYGKCDIFTEINIINCQNDPFCRKQTRCAGKVYSCRSLSSLNMQICLAPTGTTRRYNYIEYENHDVLGVKSTCTAPIINVNAWIGRCPYCMCFCDDEGYYSDRYFSLRQATSHVKKNKVITGIRFAKKNRMIHLQVQQGEILPYGIINATSLEWVPVDKIKITDRYVYNKQDYFKIALQDKAVDLHVIQVNNDKNSVLTGVRFAPVQSGANPKDKRTHLNLEIRMTKFHFESGKLFSIKGAHTWLRNLNTEYSPSNPRTQIHIENLDIPTRARSKNTIISKGEQFVEFTHTDMFKDAGQTTIPFIDSQDVVTKVPTPLVGAGVYYKSTPGYGGFIGLKIVTYDLTQHL